LVAGQKVQRILFPGGVEKDLVENYVGQKDTCAVVVIAPPWLE